MLKCSKQCKPKIRKLGFGHKDLGNLNCFGFRYSDFGFIPDSPFRVVVLSAYSLVPSC